MKTEDTTAVNDKYRQFEARFSHQEYFCDKYTVFKIFLLRDGNGNDNIEGDMD